MAGKSRMDLVKLRELHNQGMHPSDIGPILGYHPTSVIQQLYNLGLEWNRKPRASRKLTDAIEQEMITLYTGESKMGATTIAKQFNVSKKTIYDVLNKHNIGTRSVASRRRPRHKGKEMRLTDKDLEILKMHQNGLSISEIAKELYTCGSTVRYSLDKQNAYEIDEKSQTKVRQKIVNRNKGLGSGNLEIPKDRDLRHDAFESFDEIAHYWIGFLHADGCIHQGAYGAPRFHINLKGSDVPHLQKLKKWLGTKNPIRETEAVTFGKLRPFCSLAWSSKRQATLLKELGLLPHKEGRFIPDSLRDSAAFWRGMVDGDGCVYEKGKGYLYLSGSPTVIKAWSDYCDKLLSRSDSVRTEHRESVSIGSVRFADNVYRVLEVLYSGARIYLDRKYLKAGTWLPLSDIPHRKTPVD